MSSPDSSNSAINVLGAGVQLTPAIFTQSGADQLNALDLAKDSNGAITLSSSNLQKMAAAKLLDYNGTTEQYTLNIALLAPRQDAPPPILPAVQSDGLFRISNSAQIATNLLSTASPLSTQMETTPSGALQLQAAAPAQSWENPYLQGKQAKLMTLMYELAFIQSKIAVYDKDSSQKTLTRAIDNVQMQAAAIARKYDADDVRLKGDITAAQMTIGADVLGMVLQVGALTGLGLLGKTGRSSQAAATASQSSSDHLTLEREKEQIKLNRKTAEEKRELASTPAAGQQMEASRPSGLSQSKEQGAIIDENSPLLPRRPSNPADMDRGERSDDLAFTTKGEKGVQKSQEIEPAVSGDESLLSQKSIDGKLTLTPEKSPPDADFAKSSKFADLARVGLSALLGENGLNNALEKMARNYIQIVHSTTNIGANNLSSAAEQSLTSILLQKSMIEQQLAANKDQSKKTSENVQSLFDLISSLSRTSLENERTLFRG